MIKINLLSKPKPPDWRKAILLATSGALVLVGVFYGLWWVTTYRQLQSDVVAAEALLREYELVAERKAEIVRKDEEMGRWRSILSQTSSDGSIRQSVLLQAVLGARPFDVFVESVSFESGGKITIAGSAADFQRAMAYLYGLRSLNQLSEVQETSLTAESDGLASFTYTAVVERGDDQ